MVSEAGASVYSVSKVAAEELPKLSASERGAVTIARRLVRHIHPSSPIFLAVNR